VTDAGAPDTAPAPGEFDPGEFDPDREPTSRYADRIADLLGRARDDRGGVDPLDVPDEERAMGFLRDGVGQAIWVYTEAHTGGRNVWLPPAELGALRWTMNTYLELYAACYGYDIDATFTVREAAELLVDTRNVRDVAQILTGVPER